MPQLSMSIAIMEEEIKSGCNTAIFHNMIRHSFEFPTAWVATSRLDHHLLVGHGCIATGIIERKDFVSG